MKKFFKNLRHKSQTKSSSTVASPQLGTKPNLPTLVSIGYDINEKELGKLHKAAWTGDLAKVKQLAKKDSSPLDKENRTPLHLACAKGNTEVVQVLLEWKAKLNVGDNQAKTPLMKAVECGHEECVKCLLSERPDLDATDNEGNTCLHMAARDGNLNITQLLIKRGVNKDVKNKEGQSPLHLAVMGKHEAVCRHLLKEGSAVDITDRNNRTPLMKACEDGSLNLVRLLLTFNADINAEDKEHWKADDWAMMKGHHTCSQLIADYNLSQNRTSASSTPRLGSLPPSLSNTPREGEASLLGAPALNAEDDDSGDETSKMSAAGAGANDDSWGDDTDISLAPDDKKNKDGSDEGEIFPMEEQASGLHGINLSKLVKNIADSDASESAGTPKQPAFPRVDEENAADGIGMPMKKRDSTKSLQSQTSIEDDWSMQDDLPSPKRNPSRVQFKKDDELSQIHNISMQSEEETPYQSLFKSPEKSSKSPSYVPTGLSNGTGGSTFSPEKQRAQQQKNAFLEDLGITEPDDLSDPEFSSEMSPVDPVKAEPVVVAPLTGSGHDSDWDSTQVSDPQGTPRPGILKNWSKESQESEFVPQEKPDSASPDEASDWDTYSNVAEAAVKEDMPPPLPTSPVPKVQKHFDEWDNDLENAVLPVNNVPVVSKEVEALLRLRQIESQDTEDEYDDDELSEKNNESSLDSDLLHTTIGQSAKHFMGMDSSMDTTPRQTPKETLAQGDMQVDLGDKEQKLDESKVILPSAAHTNHKPAVNKNESNQHNDVMHLSGEDEDSPWDSDGDLSDRLPPAEGHKPADTNQHNQHTSSDFESESISEWEIERKKQKAMQNVSEEKEDRAELAVQPQHNGVSEDSEFDISKVNLPEVSSWHELDSKDEEARRERAEMERRNEVAEMEHMEAEKRNRETELDLMRCLHQEEERNAEPKMRENEVKHCLEMKAEEERQKQWEEERQRHWEEERQRHWEEERQGQLDEERQRQWEEEEETREQLLKTEAQKALEEECLQCSQLPSHEEILLPTVDISHTDRRTEENIEDLENQNDNQQSRRFNGIVDETGFSHPSQFNKSGEELNRIEKQVRQEKLLEASAVQKQEKTLILNATQVPNQGTRQSTVYAPPPSLPPSTSTSLELRQRLQVPPPSQMGVQSADFDDDDSTASDIYMPDSPQANRRDVTCTHPGMLGSGTCKFDMFDDGLSYTSTEFEKDDGVLGGPPPSALQNREMLINLNMNDPMSLLKIQEHLREMRQQLEHERNQRLILENKHKMITKERNDLQAKIDSLVKQKSLLEQKKLDLEAKIRNLEYNLMEEEEKNRNAQILLDKTKDQLNRKEELFIREIETRQKAELSQRNMELELKSALNKIKELEADHEHLMRDIKYLKETRQLQEKINDEQAKMHQQQHQAKIKDLTESAVVSEVSPDDRGVDQNENFKIELYALQMELEKQRVRFKEENSLLIAENEELRSKLEEVKGDIALHEDALMKAAADYSLQLNTAKSEMLVLSDNLEKEKANKEKLEAKLESNTNLLNSTVLQMEKAAEARNKIERELQQERARYQKDMELKSNEMQHLQEDNQQMSQYLKASDSKVNALENELRVAQTSLLERNTQLQQLKQQLHQLKTLHETADKNHMELNTKQQSKLESLQEKLSQIQHENLSLKQQLETLKLSSVRDANNDPHDKYNTMILNLRAESEQDKKSLQEKTMSLTETVTRLREDLRNSDNRRLTLEADLTRLNHQLNDMIKKMSRTEAALEVAEKMRPQLEVERDHLKEEVQQLQKKYLESHEVGIEAQARVKELMDRVDAAEQNSLHNSQQLANTSANMQAFSKSKETVDEIRRTLEIENARLTCELKEVKERADNLLKDLQESQTVRSTLETYTANLKTKCACLEEELGLPPEDECEEVEDAETVKRVAYEQEAKESKGLWDHEVLSRSKIGLRIAHLEKEKQEVSVQLDEEKKKSQRVTDVKRKYESKLESEKDKNQRLEKEIASLKAQVKSVKKKLKDLAGFSPQLTSTVCADRDQRITVDDTVNSLKRQNIDIGGGGVGVGYSGGGSSYFSEELIRQEMEAKFRLELNRKLDDVNRHLEEQALANNKLNTSHEQTEYQLRNEKKKLQCELSELNVKYQKLWAEHSTLEVKVHRLHTLYETEMKWRMRLSEQLQHSYGKAVDYKTKLVVDQHRSRLSGSLNFSNLTNGNGVSLDASRHNDGLSGDLSSKIQAEIDRSIAKHLEAAPHNDTNPVVLDSPDWTAAYARATADYSDLLKRKFCL